MTDNFTIGKTHNNSSVDDMPVELVPSNTSYNLGSFPLADDEVSRLARSFLESPNSWIDTCKEVLGAKVAHEEVEQFVKSFLESDANGNAKWEQLWGPSIGKGQELDKHSDASGLTAANFDDSTARAASSKVPTTDNIYPLGDNPPDSFLEFVANRLSPEGQNEFWLIQVRSAMSAIEDRLNPNSAVPQTGNNTVRQRLGVSLKSLFEREAKEIHLKGKALSNTDADFSHPKTAHGGSAARPRSAQATARRPPATGKRR